MLRLEFFYVVTAVLLASSPSQWGRLHGAPPEEFASDRIGARFYPSDTIRYPNNPAILDVTKAPYGARGDGRTDDTEAIQRALNDMMGRHQVLYFPEGTYVISRTLMWSKLNTSGGEAWGFNFLQGQNPLRTILKLKDGVFSDADNPQAMMWCGGFGSADWFHNHVHDLTFDVGRGNPGAIGLQFYSNNTGSVRRCRFLAAAESGSVGLDLAHRDMNGPLLIQDVEVVGFRRGINSGGAVNSQTLERITLRGQSQVGFENSGQAISIRSLRSENSVPAIQTYGTFCLIEAQLTGVGQASQVPSILNYNGGRIFLRDVETDGYARAIGDIVSPDVYAARNIRGEDKAGSLGPVVAEYASHATTSPFASAPGSLRLRVEEAPLVPRDPPEVWANVDAFGADPTGNIDSSGAIQRAIDSGATTVFFPGSYALAKTVRVRGKVQCLRGVGGSIDYNKQTHPDFVFEDGEATSVLIEHMTPIHGGIEINTSRTVVIKSCEVSKIVCSKAGDLFLEDVVTGDLRMRPSQHIWARQLNVENQGTHITNQGGQLWVLGYKTERGGTLVHTLAGGASEILGGFSYTTTAGDLAPMFVTEDAAVFAFFGEVCYNGDPYQMLIRETRQLTTKTVARGEGETIPYVSSPVRP